MPGDHRQTSRQSEAEVREVSGPDFGATQPGIAVGRRIAAGVAANNGGVDRESAGQEAPVPGDHRKMLRQPGSEVGEGFGSNFGSIQLGIGETWRTAASGAENNGGVNQGPGQEASPDSESPRRARSWRRSTNRSKVLARSPKFGEFKAWIRLLPGDTPMRFAQDSTLTDVDADRRFGTFKQSRSLGEYWRRNSGLPGWPDLKYILETGFAALPQEIWKRRTWAPGARKARSKRLASILEPIFFVSWSAAAQVFCVGMRVETEPRSEQVEHTRETERTRIPGAASRIEDTEPNRWWHDLSGEARVALHYLVHPDPAWRVDIRVLAGVPRCIESLARRLCQVGYGAFPVLARAYGMARGTVTIKDAKQITSLILTAIKQIGCGEKFGEEHEEAICEASDAVNSRILRSNLKETLDRLIDTTLQVARGWIDRDAHRRAHYASAKQRKESARETARSDRDITGTRRHGGDGEVRIGPGAHNATTGASHDTEGQRFHEELIAHGFQQMTFDKRIYVGAPEGENMIVGVTVDDVWIRSMGHEGANSSGGDSRDTANGRSGAWQGIAQRGRILHIARNSRPDIPRTAASDEEWPSAS